MHINKFGDVEMNTHNNIISAIEHNPNLCADLIEQHVDKFDHKICDDNNICALIDPCNVDYANKNHQFQLISGCEFFAKLSPNNCLFYTMLDKEYFCDNIFKIFEHSSYLQVDIYFHWRTCCT
jgi:hypothetical protein